MKFKWLIYNGDCNSVCRYRKNMLDRRFGMGLVQISEIFLGGAECKKCSRSIY